MIYFTRGGETKQDLIRNAFGSMPHQSIQILCNSTVLSFSPYQAIALSKHAITENEAQCAKRFQRMSTHTRYLLTSIQAQRIRPNLFISAYELLIGAASASNPYNKLSYGLMGAQVLEKLSHYHLNRIHAFTHHLSIAIDVLYKAGTATDILLRNESMQKYRAKLTRLREGFVHLLSHLMDDTRHLLHRHTTTIEHPHRHTGWHINNTRLIKKLETALHYTKQISDRLFVIDMGTAMIDVGLMLTDDPHWFPDIMHEIVDMEAFFTVSMAIDSALAILLPTPLGWIVVIGTGLGTVLTHRALMQHVLNPYLDYINRQRHAHA